MSTSRIWAGNDRLAACRRTNLLTTITVLLPLLVNGCMYCGITMPGWEAYQGEGCYTVAEQGRVVQLVDVDIRPPGSPWHGWSPVLVEPCDSQEFQNQRADVLPCWPLDKHQRKPAVLARIAKGLPGYRDRRILRNAAYLLNEDAGILHPAWIIGTQPLVLTFLDSAGASQPDFSSIPPAPGQRVTPDGTPPWIRADRTIVYGETVIHKDGSVNNIRAEVAVASQKDRTAQANVLVLFSPDLDVAASDRPLDRRDVRARMLRLGQPQSLEHLIQSLAESGGAERLAGQAIETKEFVILAKDAFRPTTRELKETKN